MAIDKQETLSGLSINEAMRKQVVYLPANATIDKAINSLIKYKINAFLTKDEDGLPVGVVSKTRYHGGLLRKFAA